MGDREDAVFRNGKQFCSAFQPVIDQIIDRRGVDIFVKYIQHTAFAQCDGICNVIQGNLIRVIFMYILQHDLELCLGPKISF